MLRKGERYDQVDDSYHSSELFDFAVSPRGLRYNSAAGAAFDELVKHKSTLLKLELDGMDLTEEQARRLPELENLEEFFFKLGAFPQSGRESLPALSHLKKCTLIHLQLDDTLPAAMEFPSTLEFLDLRLNSKITDASLPTLSHLTQLTELSLYGTGITSAGRRELQTALPNCKVQPPP